MHTIYQFVAMKHRFLLDIVDFSKKPGSDETKQINNRIIKHPIEMDVVELSQKVIAPFSRTWTPAYLEGQRKSDCWKSQSLFALDFDEGITSIKVIERLKDFGLDCTFIYSTFSSTSENPKFRVVFQLNQCIVDAQLGRKITIALLTLFPEADQTCKDGSRIFFGGLDLIYKNYDYHLEIPLLEEGSKFYSVKDSSNRNLSRDLSRHNNRLDLSLNGSKNSSVYINNIESVQNASKNSKNKIEMVRDVSFDYLRKHIKILDDFMSPNVKLQHPILLGLATNLRYIEGGQELFFDCISANSDYNFSEKQKIMHYCKNQNYPPISLINFSPYPEDWRYVNLLRASRRKETIRLEDYESIKMTEARHQLKKDFESILRSQDTLVHVFRVATGVGKTELCLELEDVVVALPNHSLKDEVSSRMKVDHMATPNFDGLPKNVRDKLHYYYSIGAINAANKYIKETAKTDQLVEEYWNDTLSCYSSEETILTTHQKALFIDWKHNTIIFDEDILSSLLPVAQINISDLIRLEGSLKNQHDKAVLTSLIDDIRGGRVNSPRAMSLSVFENFSRIEDTVLDSEVKYDGNILHFLDSKYFIVDAQDTATIHYIRKYQLPEDKKIIILSATADESIYRCLLGDRLRFYNITNVELAGLIEQDTTYSFSRTSLSTHLDYAVEKVGKLPTITFASFKDKFLNPTEELHFGKCSGFDNYRGKDIAVVGTPHPNPITVALYATALGIPIRSHDFAKAEQQCIQHNGFRFWFNTYENEELRRIQFYFIESELRQAIGRARVNIEASRVLLLSNYPLPEACVTKDEKNKGERKLEQNKRIEKEVNQNLSELKQLEFSSIPELVA